MESNFEILTIRAWLTRVVERRTPDRVNTQCRKIIEENLLPLLKQWLLIKHSSLLGEGR